MPVTPLEVRDQVIAAAIESVERTENRDYRRAGCLEGLEICRNLDTPEDYETVLAMRGATERAMHAKPTQMKTYWRHRCCTAQIAFVFERLKVAWDMPGPYSALAILQVAQIVRK